MSKHNFRVMRMYLKAQKNAELAQRLGEAIGDVDEIVKVANEFGFKFTKEEYLDHLKATLNEAKQDSGDPPYTMALGEGDGYRPSKPDFPDQDGKDKVVTLAVGENGGKPKPAPRPDKDRNFTTMAMGEEGNRPKR